MFFNLNSNLLNKVSQNELSNYNIEFLNALRQVPVKMPGVKEEVKSILKKVNIKSSNYSKSSKKIAKERKSVTFSTRVEKIEPVTKGNKTKKKKGKR